MDKKFKNTYTEYFVPDLKILMMLKICRIRHKDTQTSNWHKKSRQLAPSPGDEGGQLGVHSLVILSLVIHGKVTLN